jgi:hypothetical protein
LNQSAAIANVTATQTKTTLRSIAGRPEACDGSSQLIAAD